MNDLSVGLGEVDDRKIFSVRVSDNLMFETPLLCIGIDDVVEIKYHEPQGDGDKHFVDVSFESGAIVRCFDIVNIQFGEKEKM